MSEFSRGVDTAGNEAAAPDARQTPPPPRPRSERAKIRAWRLHLVDQGPVDVSVCIASWNCRDILRACLLSVHDQPQDVRLETIVVDNGSNDGAADMVAEEFPEVVLVRNATNLGFATANNQAAERARGRYLFFLNNDTVLPAGALGRLVAFADAHPEVGILGPRLRDGDGQVQVSYRRRPTIGALLHRTSVLRWTGLMRRAYRRYRRLDFDPITTRPVEVLMGAAMLMPRRVYQECGGWDDTFAFGGEDLELSARIGERFLIVYHPSVEITHLGRESTRQHIGFVSSNMAIGFLRYLRKCGYSRPMLWTYKAAVTLDAPIQFVGKAVQYSLRRLRGQHEKAQKSLLAMHGFGHFMAKGLLPFWRA
ncbi:MAG TPA: glycosyltransferase family 2 protein [Gemmataceae bacterium]|jgi:hypothetical protein|nr:glycosyltransferase family 2 protein [Gemmataceae bacterium]